MLRRKPNSNNEQTLPLDFHDLNLEDDVASESEDDCDLQSELDDILSGRTSGRAVKKSRKELEIVDIEKLASDCVKDIDEDIEDESSSADEELMGELQLLMGESKSAVCETASCEPLNTLHPLMDILNRRLNLYKEAEAAAILSKDHLKAHRYGRAIKVLNSQLSLARSGKHINEEDIPPVVSIPKAKDLNADRINEPTSACSEVPSRPLLNPASPEQKLIECDEQIAQPLNECAINSEVITRKNQYKKAALKAKRAGDKETALSYLKIAKQLEAVMEKEKGGHPVDLRNLPLPPAKYSDDWQCPGTAAAAENPNTKNAQSSEAAEPSAMEKAALEAANEPIDPSLFSAPLPPANVLEALEQRLQKYCMTKDAAIAEKQASKARRLQRIVQQYEDAIKSYKAGKPVNFDILPTPPGFAPIPTDDVKAVDSNVKPISPLQPYDETVSENSAVHPVLPQMNCSSTSKEQHSKAEAVTPSVMDNQLQFLLKRRKLFREEALKAKKRGDIVKAKEYLRLSKGFDGMIDAAKSGLPIDVSSIPKPPQIEADFVIIDAPEAFENELEQSSNGGFTKLEKELKRQIELCAKYTQNLTACGDLANATTFEKLGHASKKDLILIQYLRHNNEPPPKFHYEMRVFSIVQCNSDLSNNEVEITVLRAINLPGKAESLDSYVKVELGIPSEAPQRGKTRVIYDTNNPTFQDIIKFEINRKSRSQLRQFRRHVLKFEVRSKGGFFRGDMFLGHVTMRLIELEHKCTIHSCLDLLDGRKATGAKLEVQIRVRSPFSKKQIEEVEEKWLVFS